MSSSAVLHGLDLESEHCMFQNENGKVTLVPLGGAQCSVNGVQVTEPSQLNQGERTETCDVSSAVFTSLSENMFQPSEVKVLTVFTLWSRCCYPARQDQHVSLQPSKGGGQAAGETKGKTVSLETGPAEGVYSTEPLTVPFSSSEWPSLFIQPLYDGSVQVL